MSKRLRLEDGGNQGHLGWPQPGTEVKIAVDLSRSKWVYCVTVIDDFAHHPTAVAGAIAAIRSRYPRRRLWAVFEPRSNTSRRKVFQRGHVNAFGTADRVIVVGVFRKETDRVSADELFSPEQWWPISPHAASPPPPWRSRRRSPSASPPKRVQAMWFYSCRMGPSVACAISCRSN